MSENLYPKTFKASEAVSDVYAPGLWRIKGGKATYHQVWMADGGQACYLVRFNDDLSFTKRWIDWDTELEKMYNPFAPKEAAQ